MRTYNSDGQQTYAVDPRAIWSISCCRCRRRSYIVATSFEKYVEKAKNDGWVGKRIMNVVCPECIEEVERTFLNE